MADSNTTPSTVKQTIDQLKDGVPEQVGSAAAAPSDTPAGLVDDERMVVFDGTEFPVSDLSTAMLDRSAIDHGKGSVFKVRLARSRTVQDASALVRRRYEERGYDTPGAPPEDDHNLLTFVAYNQGVIVGTVSIRLDAAGASPLGAEELYAAELTKLRQAGARICEFTRLAVETEISSKPVLAALFHTAYLFAYRVRGYDCAVIEVNPRHVVFYRRALKFDVIGAERLNRRVNAPGVLLCVPFETIAQGIAQFAGNAELVGKTHTLFPYGFPPDEEAGVLNRLRHLEAAQLV
jgi:hypothetical protein